MRQIAQYSLEENEGRFGRVRLSKRMLVLAIGLVGLSTAQAGSAATQLGETFTPSGTFCGGNFTNFQTTSPGGQYVVPFSGVITSWSYEANATGPTGLKLKVGRLVPPPVSIRIVGESGLEIPTLSATRTFATRITVQRDDLIGTYQPTSAQCKRPATGYIRYFTGGDPGVGTATAFGPDPGNPVQLDLAATLEPDADADGFGDETQDLCPTDAATQSQCPDRVQPQVSITKGPKDKTKKKQATFEFTGTDARAVASFECSLDNGAFAVCTARLTLKVKTGKHIFQVRAVDQAGNVGAAASDDWKRKKTRRRSR